jgi:membrane associated rhomboid family serine protease
MNGNPLGGAPRASEPIFFIPAVVLAFVVLLLGTHAVLSAFSEAARDQIYFDWGFVPGRFTAAVAPQWIRQLVERAGSDSSALAAARLLRDAGALDDGAGYPTLLTYSLLHASWTHVGLNTMWMLTFGPPVARRFGPLRFVLFFFFTAIAGALAQWISAPYSAYPVIGASAADSGLMGAAARFIFRPGAALGFRPVAAALQTRASSLRELVFDRNALVFIAIWMATNFLFGVGATALGASDAPVAWLAHVGGFLAGLFAFGLFDRGPAASASA